MIAVWLFLAVPWVCLQCVNVVIPDHTQYILLTNVYAKLASPRLEIELLLVNGGTVLCSLA